MAAFDPGDPPSDPPSVPPPSGIAVPFTVPPGIARLRRHWDRAAAGGARPHVTVLYPFLPEPDLTPAIRSELAAIASTVRPFEVAFEAVRRFEGVVWLEPEPAAPFRALTDAIAARWPAWPPYGGLFDEVIPHLTVVESDTAPLDEIAEAASRHVPFRREARSMEVWRQDEAGMWHPRWRLPLGGIRP